jgi:hypothetical protein
MNVEIGAEAALFPEKEYINGFAVAVQGRAKISCTYHGKPNKPTKEGPLSFVLFESPFTSVSTVSRGHPSLVSLPTPSHSQS